MKFVLASLVVAASAAEYKKGKCGGDSKWSYDIYSPEAAGDYPIMVYVTGFGGTVPGYTYSNLAKAIADKGVVVTMLSRLAPPQPKTDAALESKALDWLEQNVNALGLQASANFDQLVLSGHSAGNHVFCELLKDNCGNSKAKAAVMMDPVDGFDPFGIVKNYCINDGEKTNFDTPALLLRTGLDPVVKHLVACAPDKLSNDHFYNAWSGPIWMVNATKYGHLGVNDASVSGMGGVVCADSDEPKDVYQSQIADLVDDFFSMIFKGDATAEARIIDVSTKRVDSEVVKNYNGHSAPFEGGCSLSTLV